MWVKLILLLYGLIALVGCSTPPVISPSEPLRLLTEDEYAARREAALEQVLVWNDVSEGYEFRGHTEYVYLSNFEFAPSVIHLKSGTVALVSLNNISRVTHYFGGEELFRRGAEVIDIFGRIEVPKQYNILVPPLATRNIYLFIKDPGEYPLICFVPTHRDRGMTGTLIVEP